MQQLGPIMRGIELQRIVEDTVSEWRSRSRGHTGDVTATYQNNFRRQVRRRRNSAEIERIKAKYAQTAGIADASRTDHDRPFAWPRRDPKERLPKEAELLPKTLTQADELIKTKSSIEPLPQVPKRTEKEQLQVTPKFEYSLPRTPKLRELFPKVPKRKEESETPSNVSKQTHEPSQSPKPEKPPSVPKRKELFPRVSKQAEKPPQTPKRPVRLKRFSRLIGSKSEADITAMEDTAPVFDKERFANYGIHKFNKSCEDLAECNVEYRLKSRNFDERSILSERCTQSPNTSPISFSRFPNIAEETSVSSFEDIGSPLASSTPKQRPNTAPGKALHHSVSVEDAVGKSDRKSVSLFERLRPVGMRKGVSEPQLSAAFDAESSQTLGPETARKRWRMRPFRKGLGCLLPWPRKKGDRIQELDDSFFEKFGSILKQVSQQAAEQESTPLAPLVEDVEPKISEQCATESSASVSTAQDNDSGTETLLDTDSEPDDPEKIDLVGQSVGMNIDELYLEILYEILHNVGGCDAAAEVGCDAKLAFVQDVFKVPNERHVQLLTEAEAKEPPEIMLNVEVIEAKDLVPKDPNGLSDPFVTIYLMSSTSHRYNTSVRTGTLNPSWEEHFSLPMPENLNEDSLCLEVWDFDPAETVREKTKKIFEVKGVKGLRKWMKEIAITASTGKHDNELIGRANIPLKSIPASGLTMWYSLDKKSKLKRQGVVKVRLNFSSEKNSQVAAQEHRHLLRILLLHELDNSKVAPYWWCGNFSSQAEAIITQHVAQSGLSATDNYLSQWVVYCGIMADHPLSFSLFNSLLDRLTKPILSGAIGEEEVKLFWDGARKLLPVCFSLVRKLRKKTAGDKAVIKNLREVLTILNKISLIEVPDSIDLFPSSLYSGWLRRREGKYSVYEVLQQAAIQGASDWFVHILENNECKDSSEEGRLQHLIRVIQLVRSDLQRAIEYYDKIFIEHMHFPYTKNLYAMYESKVASLVEPEVTEVCKSMTRLHYDEDVGQSVTLAGGLNGGTGLGGPKLTNEPMAMGTALFELYLALQRFVTLGQGLETDWQNFRISRFHGWFADGVAQWLDIAVYKARTRIDKAVELDQLIAVDANVNYSSSAVDTLAIYYQIKIFWQQLAWPDVEGTYTFVAKIIDDICMCSVYYADKMAERVRGVGEISSVYESSKFEVTTEWCLAINNIEHVRNRLGPFVEELGMEVIIARMCELKTAMEAQRCKECLQNVVANAIDTVRNKIIELIEKMVKKMMPSITRFLVEGAELLNNDCQSMDRVMMYLDSNLNVLYQNLNKENFSRTLDIIWEQISDVLYELIQSNIEKRRPPSFFANLHECLNQMVASFTTNGQEPVSSESLKGVKRLLNLHGMETRELIHQFHLERWQAQQTISEPSLGMLTVRAQFVDSGLRLEVMNARNLVPADSNGLCDSYVRVTPMPEDLFADVVKPKTQTYNKSLFPLYDEVFDIPLTSPQRSIRDGLLQLAVKDKDLFSLSSQFMGEAYLHWSEIPETPAPLTSLPQAHLPLSKPTAVESETIKALETRQGDRQARDFLKKLKQKTPTATGKSNFSFSRS